MSNSHQKKGGALFRFAKEQWKGVIAGLSLALIPISANYYLTQKDKWHELDQRITVLVNSVIYLDNVPPSLQPVFSAPRSERIMFVRDYQSTNHANEWFQIQKQIPLVSEDSDLSPYDRAIAGHKAIGQKVHGAEAFAKAELRQQTDLIEQGFDGETFNGPLSLLAHVETSSLDQLKPANDSDVQVRWLLVSDWQLRNFADTPRLDLSNPEVSALLIKAGFGADAFSETTAVPALTELSDSVYQVEAVAMRN